MVIDIVGVEGANDIACITSSGDLYVLSVATRNLAIAVDKMPDDRTGLVTAFATSCVDTSTVDDGIINLTAGDFTGNVTSNYTGVMVCVNICIPNGQIRDLTAGSNIAEQSSCGIAAVVDRKITDRLATAIKRSTEETRRFGCH